MVAAALSASSSSRQAASAGAPRALIIWLVRQAAWPGAGLRSGAARVPGGLGCLGGGSGLPDARGRGLPGRVEHHPVRVIRGGGVGAGGVQGEPGAGVAEVVLLPPPELIRQHTSPAGKSVREVSAWICRVAPAFAETRRVTCRSVTVWPLRDPSLMPGSTVESASSYSWRCR